MAELLYQGHGSFRICTAAGAVIYVDPFAGDGYDRAANLVLVTHEHYDHNQVDLVTLKDGGKILRAADFLQNGARRFPAWLPTTKTIPRISAWASS